VSLGRRITSSLRRNELLRGIRVSSEMYDAYKYRVKAKCRLRYTRTSATFTAEYVTVEQVLNLVRNTSYYNRCYV